MSSLAAVEGNTGFTLSDISLRVPENNNRRFSSSVPFLKPNLSNSPHQNVVEKMKLIGKRCCQQFRRAVIKTPEPQDDFSLDETKTILQELANELERVFQPKISLMSENTKKASKETHEEQEQYFSQWAGFLENAHHKDELLLEPSPSMELETTTQVLSDWSDQLKELKPNSIIPESESEKVLRGLHREWRQGQSTVLPVMDWMIWTVLHSKSSEEAVSRQWIKRSKNSATPELFIPKPVWHWITKNAAVIVLDPNTANPELLISADKKSLRAKPYTKVDNWYGYQRRKTTYDGWMCVQAIQGYNTGCHYWEVDVKRKYEWRVGVVKESACRNGYITMNTKAGYWNLRLQMGTLLALTEPVIKLNIQIPSRIGVYLDIEIGLVSFCDAIRRRHIYTFNTNFKESEYIYPVFGTIETDREMKIE